MSKIEKRKSIMLHVRSEKLLKSYIENKDEGISQEVKHLIQELPKRGWNVYLTTLENIEIENKLWKDVYYLNGHERRNLTISDVNDKIDIIMIRNVGSVEANFDKLQKYLTFLIDEYKGKVLNNPKAMKKGMTKNYLLEIDKNYMKSIGIKTIQTKAYPNSVSIEEIIRDFSNLDNYIIKPITGELSNSLTTLDKIDEKFLRNKETKVGGWIVQPIQEQIWNGEYQLVFIDNELIYSQQKQYTRKNNEKFPEQKNRIISKYEPSNEEIEKAKKLNICLIFMI